MKLLKFILLSFFFLSHLSAQENPKKPTVLVTIAPYKFFVEKIAGNTLQVALLVPPAASSHTFEPTPRETLEASKASIWFIMGEPFEEKALVAFKAHNTSLQIVDLRDGIDLIYSTHTCEHHCNHHHKESADLHLWLSLKNAEIQAKTIANKLIKTYPEHTESYTLALEAFIQELADLDSEIDTILRPLQNRTFLVSHPAYAYFCRDYDLVQLSVEFEGKDPTPKQLTNTLQLAKLNEIKTIFTQKQYSNKGAKLIASQIKAQVIELDPYSSDYYNSIRDIAIHFAKK